MAAHVARRRDGISRHALCLFCPVAAHRRVSGSMAPEIESLFAPRALSDRRAGAASARKHPDAVRRCYSQRGWLDEHFFPARKSAASQREAVMNFRARFQLHGSSVTEMWKFGCRRRERSALVIHEILPDFAQVDQ
jgi:hypothetical protein